MIELAAIGAAVSGAAVYGLYRLRNRDSGSNVDYEAHTFDCNDDAEDPAYEDTPRDEIEAASENDEPNDGDPTPEVVTEKSGLTEIKGVGATRAEKLGKAGFSDPEDIYYATDGNLVEVDGIGQYTVDQMRSDIGSVDDDPTGESDDDTEATPDSTDESTDGEAADGGSGDESTEDDGSGDESDEDSDE